MSKYINFKSFINDGIFVVTSFEILFGLTGCLNPDYLEYNALPFIEEDTTLSNSVIFGCMNETYCEYNPLQILMMVLVLDYLVV